MHFPRLLELRKENKLTQQQAAEILFCQREVYRRYEVGVNDIPVSYAIMLAKRYNVTLDYLLGMSDER